MPPAARPGQPAPAGQIKKDGKDNRDITLHQDSDGSSHRVRRDRDTDDTTVDMKPLF